MRTQARRRVAVSSPLAAVAGLAAFTVGASPAVAASPRWQITAVPYPAAFQPGTSGREDATAPGILIKAANIGDGPTVSEFILHSEVSEGLTVSTAGSGPRWSYGPSSGPESFGSTVEPRFCEAAGSESTCRSAGPIYPGQEMTMWLPVTVQANAPSTVAAQIRVEGGGAPDAATQVQVATSGARLPFGFLEGT